MKIFLSLDGFVEWGDTEDTVVSPSMEDALRTALAKHGYAKLVLKQGWWYQSVILPPPPGVADSWLNEQARAKILAFRKFELRGFVKGVTC